MRHASGSDVDAIGGGGLLECQKSAKTRHAAIMRGQRDAAIGDFTSLRRGID
jgi:hypothetical protein